MNKIKENVLEKTTPTQEYRKKLKNIIKEIEIKIKEEIEKRKIPAEIKLVGSIAKDTYLMNNMDIDFFLCFPSNLKKDKIAENALFIGRKILNDTEESYAEHPYIRGYFKDYYVEIVPCYKIEKSSQKLSAVDRTPLHTEYVKKNLNEEQKKEVRLFKQFLKGINCYGAEAQIQGFSGYLCEILIIYYDSFENLLRNVKEWRFNTTLSLKDENHPDFDTPLVFIDPVDSNRNVASALSKEKFDLFIKASIKYLKKPNIKFFFPNPIKAWSIEKIKKEIQKQKSKYLAIKFDEPGIIDENLYPQLRKAQKSIEKICLENDFKVYDTEFFIDKEKKDILLLIKAENKELSYTKIHEGPPLELSKNVDEFNKKWKNDKRVVKGPFEKNKRIYVEIKREYRDIKEFLKHILLNLSLGKHLDKVIEKKYDILEINDLLNEDLRIFWTDYLDDRHSWER